MNTMVLDFSPVSVEEAARAHELPPPGIRPLAAAPALDNGARQRRAASSVQLTLTSGRWMAELPRELVPRQLAMRHPRIVNELCQRWSSPGSAAAYLDSLIIDDRGNRQGFGQAILAELVALRTSLDESAAPAEAWQDVRPH